MDMINLTRLHGWPQSIGMLKTNLEEFMVVEELVLKLYGEGEHVLLSIRKTSCNTQCVADYLVRFTGFTGIHT